MTADDILVAITQTPVAPINPISKHREQTYYVWKTVDGEWVRTDHPRIAQWEKLGVAYARIHHIWDSYRKELNGNGDKDIVTQTVDGPFRSEYLAKVMPTGTVVAESDNQTTVRWTF